MKRVGGVLAGIWDMSCSASMEMLCGICKPTLHLERLQTSMVCYSRDRPGERETGLEKLAMGMVALSAIPAREPITEGIFAIIHTNGQ